MEITAAPAWVKTPGRVAVDESAADLSRAWVAARDSGVTRLAEITGLDRLGYPVFQAVRPWGRSLSVHQGKGLEPADAAIGALMEAVESDRAERFTGRPRLCAFSELAPSERAPRVDDFAWERGCDPGTDSPVAWTPARRPGGTAPLYVPFAAVSADYSRPVEPWVERASNGLGARFDNQGAEIKALMELIERDAERAWRSTPLGRRGLAQVDCASIADPWFQDLLARAGSLGLFVSVYRLPGVVDVFVMACELHEPGGGRRARTAGTGCAFTAVEALRAAVLEAVQSRLTAISGVRDDIPAIVSDRPTLGLALPPTEDAALMPWNDVLASCRDVPSPSSEGLVSALAEAGYPDVGLVDLSTLQDVARVIKAFVPGLGAHSRVRRPPAWAN